MTTIKQGGRTYDTNNQSDRADLRKQGYFIDNSGVYSPGGNGSKNGQRVGDTWNAGGGMANGAQQNNEAPNNVFLPLSNGTPQSPLGAQTYGGGQNGAVSVSDPAFASLFGPGSYFFSTGGPSNYGWMQGGARASNPNDFMSAITNYLNGVSTVQPPAAGTSSAMPQTNVSPANSGSMQGFNQRTYSPVSQAPINTGGPQMNNTDYLMMLRQMYPGLYGQGPLTGGTSG